MNFFGNPAIFHLMFSKITIEAGAFQPNALVCICCWKAKFRRNSNPKICAVPHLIWKLDFDHLTACKMLIYLKTGKTIPYFQI